MIASATAATPIAAGVERRGVRDERLPLREELRRHGAHLQPEEILDLAREDDHRDPARESGDDRMRDELDHASELARPSTMSMTPAMIVATVSPPTPYCCTMP